jgi:glycerol kinase
LCKHDPKIARRLQDGSALVGTIDTYLIYRFTEGRVFATEPTNACRTLLYDIHRLCWDEDLCGLFGIPMRALAEVRPCDAHFGETRLEGCLERATPICGVMGDSQAALFAQRCFQPGAVKMTLGSGTSVLVNTGEKKPEAAEGIVSTVAWITHTGLVYALEGIINFSGATISWLKNQLGLIETATETEALALSVESSAGVYLVPAFVGMGAPHWAANARAAILGLTPQATRAHVVRAGLEAIGYQIKDVLDWMAPGGPLNPPGDIHADGGAVRNRFLTQFIADMTRRTVLVPDVAELSALGAVYAGMLGMNEVVGLADLERLPRKIIEYHPVMPLERALTLYQGWQEAVKRVL